MQLISRRIHRVIPATVFLVFIFLSGLAYSSESPLTSGRSLVSANRETIEKLEALHYRAEEQILMNDFRGAIDTYWNIVFLEPDDESAYTGMGRAYLVLGSYKRAHDAFDNALKINPRNTYALLGIQKIMDPDGVEGMVTPVQAEGADPVLADHNARMNPDPQSNR